MADFIDYLGQRFGKLVVVSRAKNRKAKVYWLCDCDCGLRVELGAYALKKKINCGCERKARNPVTRENGGGPYSPYSDRSMAAKNFMYKNYKRSAKDRGHLFKLSFEEFIELVQQNCYYCGEKSSNVTKVKRSKFACNGLDRVNNVGDYELSNVVPCCKRCNRAKWKRGKKEFIDWVNRCYNHLILNSL